MKDNKCVKCGEAGGPIKITIEDGEFSSTLGEVFCQDCYRSLEECLIEMIYEDEVE